MKSNRNQGAQAELAHAEPAVLHQGPAGGGFALKELAVPDIKPVRLRSAVYRSIDYVRSEKYVRTGHN